MTRNSIFLYRKRKVILAEGRGQVQLPDPYLATALQNIESLGFTFSTALISRIRTFSAAAFAEFYFQLVADLKKTVGAHREFQPMYPNFPEQVMQEEESTLYINALLHDLIGILPDTQAVERAPLSERPRLKVIDLGSVAEFDQMIKQLIGAKSSISEADKADVDWVVENYEDLQSIWPDEIPLKENVGVVVGSLLTHEKASLQQIAPYIKTATDVLRLATALSDGDVSLAGNSIFRKFKRSERRLLLGLLEQCPNITEDMLRQTGRWIRLGEILHPAEYKSRYPKAHAAFDILRNNKDFPTFAGRLEQALLHRQLDEAVSLLKTRPGYFARRLDHLLRLATDGRMILDHFAEVIDGVSTPVLLQVRSHFQHRPEKKEHRTFFPKGNVAKLVAVENQLPELDESVCRSVVKMCEAALTRRFATLASLGRVWIDERLKQHVVPFSQRSASKSLRTLVRGSQLDLPEGNTIRFFLWWKEGEVNGVPTYGVDIDLSAVLYDEHWRYEEQISYTNLRSEELRAYHSGDITSAPEGACEFIDLDIESLLRGGIRYVVMSLNSFTDHPYSDLPECFAGWMMREHPNSGEIFEPSTVQDKVDVAANTTICLPVILDLAEKKVIWTDLALRQHPYYDNDVEGNHHGMMWLGKAMTTLSKPNLYDLFALHASSRGVRVEERQHADTIFSLEEGVTPFDIERIMADFM
jgi:hypothetical protein